MTTPLPASPGRLLTAETWTEWGILYTSLLGSHLVEYGDDEQTARTEFEQTRCGAGETRSLVTRTVRATRWRHTTTLRGPTA